MSGRDRVIGLSMLIVAVLAFGLIELGRAPQIPAGAGGQVLARMLPTGPVDPDGYSDDHPLGPKSPQGQACLPRIQKGSAWADVCWEIGRDPQDGSPTQDFYYLRVHGSYSGMKWLIARADLVGSPNGGAYVVWPDYRIEGQCRSISVHLGPAVARVEPTEEVCGATTGDLADGSWVQTLTWTCEFCLLPDNATKPLSMWAKLAVDVGTVPEWDLSVDGGS